LLSSFSDALVPPAVRAAELGLDFELTGNAVPAALSKPPQGRAASPSRMGR
jgi:hypothetical protein